MSSSLRGTAGVPPRPEQGEVLYGATIRPPHFRMHRGRFVCDTLEAVDEASVAGLPGLRRVVRHGNFLGVVAEHPDTARRAAARIGASWRSGVPGDGAGPGTERTPAPAAAKQVDRPPEAGLDARYAWPNRIRWGDRAEWVVAAPGDDALVVWADSHMPELLRTELAALAGLPVERVEVVTGSSGVGRTCADDAAADAALLALAVRHPVAVRLSADYTGVAEALGTAQQVAVSAHWTDAVRVTAYEQTQEPTNAAPALALLLAGTEAPAGPREEPGEAPYAFESSRIAVPAGPEGGGIPGLGGLHHTFARESCLDEVAERTGTDPLELRRRHLRDARGLNLLDSVARQADWRGTGAARPPAGDILRGRGVAYAHTPDPDGDRDAGARSAWIVDVEVNRITGEVCLARLVIGQDSGEAVDSTALGEQLQQAVVGQGRPLLAPRGRFDDWAAEDPGAGDTAATPPTVEAVVPASGAAPPAARPAATPPVRLATGTLEPGVAALANAIFDATGIRFRQPPFSPDRIRPELAEATGRPPGRRFPSRWRILCATTLASAAGLLALSSPWRPAVEPVSRPSQDLYSAATLERGRLVAEAGNCMVCHTTPGGITNAGGRAFETPFGRLYSTNLTPDPETGIGSWSYAAFERAMREGIGRDGRHLYPAFPYTAFAGMSDADMRALYAYLMAQPAVSSEPPAADLSFPFGIRPLMAGWNTLFHRNERFRPDPARSAQWNRGAYLAETVGHCSACHTPRNALGAERGGSARYAGAMVEGWEAPPLNGLSHAPVPWTEESLYRYLRHGFSPTHGVAGGPMAPVVAGLQELPDEDVRAMAVYVGSLSDGAGDEAPEGLTERAERVRQRAAATGIVGMETGERIYENSCAACHEPGGVPSLTDARTSLALNSNLHSDRPHNLIRTILHGVLPAGPELSDMPGFSDSLDDRQVAALAEYLRARFAPGRDSWQDLERVTRDIRHITINQ